MKASGTREREKSGVTILSSMPPVKGISDYTVELVKELSNKNSVTVLGFNNIYPKFLYGDDPKDLSRSALNKKNLKVKNVLNWYNPFGWIFRSLKIDSPIIHVQWWSYVLSPIYLTVLLIAKIRRKKIVITIHNISPHEKSKLADLANRSVLFFGDWFIVHTNQAKQKFSSLYPKKRNKTSVINHGVLAPKRSPGQTKLSTRKSLNLSRDDNVVLFFGSIRDYKGLDDLLRAISLAKEHVDNIKLIIAGKPWGDWDKYQRIIDDKNLNSNVLQFLGFVPDSEISTYFIATDIVVLPYKFFDAQSGVAAKSLPFRKPLVVTNAGGLPDLTRDSAVVEPENPSALSEVICKSFNDNSFLNSLKKTAAIKEKEYSWDKIAKDTQKLYSKVMKMSK